MESSLFKDKVYIVTGGAAGIGLEIVKQLASAGAYAYAVDIHAERSAELAKLESCRICYLSCDVRFRDKCHFVVESVVDQHGRLDGMINNAGVCELEGELPSDEVFTRTMDINVRGVWNMGVEAIVQMKLQEFGGSIINIGSTSALKGEMRLPVYTASKHAVAGLTRTWALDQAKYKIRVNCVAPGSHCESVHAG